MTTPEFDREFDILYDNVASKGAPGINTYEKSVFLTKAQEELVESNYSGQDSNFEMNERTRRLLSNITFPYSTSVKVESSLGISPNSNFFVVPLETWYIVHESITITGPEKCLKEKVISVKPITHDEYNVSSKSPFRKPNKRKAWRVDVSLSSNNNLVEIISEYEILKYNMRYVKKPEPIVLVDLSTDAQYTGLNLSIDGITAKTECKLNSALHRNILDRAVQLAILGYRENSLSNNVELSKRNV